MADITMCSGEGCTEKETCKRFTSTVNPYRQSYFAHPPIKDGKCEMYWGGRQDYIMGQLTDIVKGINEQD